jgi:hypothetical protein
LDKKKQRKYQPLPSIPHDLAIKTELSKPRIVTPICLDMLLLTSLVKGFCKNRLITKFYLSLSLCAEQAGN